MMIISNLHGPLSGREGRGEKGGGRREGEFHFIVPLYERSINISKDEDKIHSYLFVRFARVFF